MVQHIQDNWAQITTVAAAIHVIALTIINLTPSKKDDEFYNRAYKVIEFMAGIITKKAKQ